MHNPVIKWNKLKDMAAYDAAKGKGGWQGRSSLGYWTGYPLTGMIVIAQDFSTIPAAGKTTGYVIEISPKAAIEKRDAKRPDLPIQHLFGGTIAHEIGTHILAGYAGHDTPKGDIDSEAGKLDGGWGKKACDAMCKRMEIDR